MVVNGMYFSIVSKSKEQHHSVIKKRKRKNMYPTGSFLIVYIFEQLKALMRNEAFMYLRIGFGL